MVFYHSNRLEDWEGKSLLQKLSYTLSHNAFKVTAV